MEKDFVEWHSEKRKIEGKQVRFFFYEREIWVCSLGENIGLEQDGKGEQFLRPVVILKRFNSRFMLVVPLTSQENSFMVVRHSFVFRANVMSFCLLHQLRAVDSKRLSYRIGMMPTKSFCSLKIKIKQLFA